MRRLRKSLLTFFAATMVAQAALAQPAPASASNVLGEVFVRGCLEGQVAADKLTQVEARDVPRTVLKDSKRADDVRVFSVSGVRDSYLIVANYSDQKDGLVQRCGILSALWNVEEAKAAVLGNPLLRGDRVAGGLLTENRGGRFLWGVQHSARYDSEIVYGRSGRLTHMMMSAYDPPAAERRRAAIKQMTDCSSKPPAPEANCDERWWERVHETLRSYSEL